MGFNTVALLLNDHTDRWPGDMLHAMQLWTPHHLADGRINRSGHFGWGQIISTAHADEVQVSVCHTNTGQRLSSVWPVRFPNDLTHMADVLRGHGYSVKAPGDARAKGPLTWGYAAKNKAVQS
jgi:hypothetical protein